MAVISHWEDMAIRAELEKAPIPLASYEMSGEEKAKIIAKITGKDVDYICDRPTEGFNAHPMLKAMYLWTDEGVDYRSIPSPILLKLGVRFHTFEDYVQETVVPFIAEQK